MFDRVLVVVRSVRVRSCGRLLLVMRRCMEMGLTSYVFVVLRSEEVWTALVGDCLRMEFMCGARPCTLDQNVLSRETTKTDDSIVEMWLKMLSAQ
jgi:hypothetical protein